MLPLCALLCDNSSLSLFSALISLLKFLLSRESDFVKKHNIFQLASQAVNIFNLFITYGDTFLPSPGSYDELYYEVIRMHQVFDSMYSMGRMLFLNVLSDLWWYVTISSFLIKHDFYPCKPKRSGWGSCRVIFVVIKLLNCKHFKWYRVVIFYGSMVFLKMGVCWYSSVHQLQKYIYSLKVCKSWATFGVHTVVV